MFKRLTRSVIKTQEIAIPGGDSFAVRGLSLPDILQIYNRHSGALGTWFERLAGEAEIQPANIATSLMSTAPVLAAEIIAFGSGSGDDETIAIASELALSAQIEALQAIADMTFTESMPPKKVLEIVIQAARAAAIPFVQPAQA